MFFYTLNSSSTVKDFQWDLLHQKNTWFQNCAMDVQGILQECRGFPNIPCCKEWVEISTNKTTFRMSKDTRRDHRHPTRKWQSLLLINGPNVLWNICSYYYCLLCNHTYLKEKCSAKEICLAYHLSAKRIIVICWKIVPFLPISTHLYFIEFLRTP